VIATCGQEGNFINHAAQKVDYFIAGVNFGTITTI